MTIDVKATRIRHERHESGACSEHAPAHHAQAVAPKTAAEAPEISSAKLAKLNPGASPSEKTSVRGGASPAELWGPKEGKKHNDEACERLEGEMKEVEGKIDHKCKKLRRKWGRSRASTRTKVLEDLARSGRVPEQLRPQVDEALTKLKTLEQDAENTCNPIERLSLERQRRKIATGLAKELKSCGAEVALLQAVERVDGSDDGDDSLSRLVRWWQTLKASLDALMGYQSRFSRELDRRSEERDYHHENTLQDVQRSLRILNDQRVQEVRTEDWTLSVPTAQVKRVTEPPASPSSPAFAGHGALIRG